MKNILDPVYANSFLYQRLRSCQSVVTASEIPAMFAEYFGLLPVDALLADARGLCQDWCFRLRDDLRSALWILLDHRITRFDVRSEMENAGWQSDTSPGNEPSRSTSAFAGYHA